MKTKIIFLIPNLKHGGAEKVLVNLANNLDQNRYDVTIQTLFDVGVNKKYIEPHVHYRSFWKKEFRGNSYIFKMFSPSFWWKKIVKEQYDVAISYLEGPTARILSGCNDSHTKKVSWIHIELPTEKLAAQGFKSVQEAKDAYESFDNVIAVSKTVKECFENSLKIKNKVEVLYNTNETEQIIKKSKESINDVNFIEDDVLSVCSVAKLMKTKGYDRLIEVHKRLLKEGIEHRVYILGIGEEQAYLESKIKEYGLEKSFILLGFHDNPYKYVKRCDLYVCSSRREGFSTAVTEALVVGTPVVSTNCSGAKELLGDHNEYGIVVENSTEGVYDGMKKMLTDSHMLQYYKEQAALQGERFSKDRTVKAVEDMIEKL